MARPASDRWTICRFNGLKNDLSFLNEQITDREITASATNRLLKYARRSESIGIEAPSTAQNCGNSRKEATYKGGIKREGTWPYLLSPARWCTSFGRDRIGSVFF